MVSFTPFPLLPTELRLKIWEQIFRSTSPQVLNIYTLCFPNPDEIDDFLGIDSNGEIILDNCYVWLHQFLPSRAVPSILHINSEARTLFLAHYQLGFTYHTLTDPPPFLPKTCDHLTAVRSEKRNFYWNPNFDIIHYTNFPDVLIPSPTNPNRYEYISTLQNTTTMWYTERHALHSPRFLSVSLSMLLDWFGPHSRKPDLSKTELLGVIVEKDPRHSDYSDEQAWRDHQIQVADTDSWEESEVYLEGRLREIIGGGIWKGGFGPGEGMVVRVLRRLEDFVGVVEGLRRKRRVVAKVGGIGEGGEEEEEECLVQ